MYISKHGTAGAPWGVTRGVVPASRRNNSAPIQLTTLPCLRPRGRIMPADGSFLFFCSPHCRTTMRLFSDTFEAIGEDEISSPNPQFFDLASSRLRSGRRAQQLPSVRACLASSCGSSRCGPEQLSLVKRPRLTTGQRAMVGEKLANLRNGVRADQAAIGIPIATLSITREQAAEQANTTPEAINQARMRETVDAG